MAAGKISGHRPRGSGPAGAGPVAADKEAAFIIERTLAYATDPVVADASQNLLAGSDLEFPSHFRGAIGPGGARGRARARRCVAEEQPRVWTLGAVETHRGPWWTGVD